MSASKRKSALDQTEDKTLMKIRPTRFISWTLYLRMFICYAIVAVFAWLRPIDSYVDLSGVGLSWLIDWEVAGLTLDLIIAIAFLFVALYYFARAELKRAGTVYMITENKIVRKDGMLSKADSLTERRHGTSARNWVPRSSNEAARANSERDISDVRICHTQVIPYTHIEKVDLLQGLSERALRVGTLKIDTGEEEVWFDDIPNAEKVQDLIMSRVGQVSFSRQREISLSHRGERE